MADLKPKYPTREWFGKYSAWLSYELSRSTHKAYSEALELFFATFPKRTGIEQFSATDVADFIELQTKRPNANFEVIKVQLVAISSMWKYLTDVKQLPTIYNIGKVYKRKNLEHGGVGLKSKNSLSLQETFRLVDAIEDIKVKHDLLDLIAGERVIFNKHSPRFDEFKKAAVKLGIPNVSPSLIRQKINGRLHKDIIKEYVEQVRRQLPNRPTQYGSFTEGSPSHLEQAVLLDRQTLLHWYRQTNSQIPSQPLPEQCPEGHLQTSTSETASLHLAP